MKKNGFNLPFYCADKCKIDYVKKNIIAVPCTIDANSCARNNAVLHCVDLYELH